ncbi:MAG: hypothetical protein LBS53_01285 [Synergistaceae bacterium]|nr:hypothetical protein [Synergistaceae bacterium]
MPENAILCLIQHIYGSIMELEVALNKVIHCAEINSGSMSNENLGVWLGDLIRNGSKTQE